MIVKGYGSVDSKIVIVGEAPGKDEVQKGIPFVGSSGRLLDEMLSRNGIHRSECYLTNILQNRPMPNNNDFGLMYYDKKRTDPKPLLIGEISRLKDEIRRINPFIILGLGNEVLKALTGHSGITKWRGSVLLFNGIKIICTFHPSNILRQYANRAPCELDIRRVCKESHKREYVRTDPKIELAPSYERVVGYLQDIWINKKRFAFDIEALGKRVRCLSISTRIDHAIVIPFMTLSHFGLRKGYREVLFMGEKNESSLGDYWSLEEEKGVLHELYLTFKDPGIEKIAQNFPYDSTMLGDEFGFVINGLWMDTLAAQHCVYPELPKSLDFLCSVYTRYGYYAEHNVGDDLDEWRYNGMDALVDFKVAIELEKEMKEHGVYDFYRYHVQPALLALTRCQNRGMFVDLNVRNSVRIREEKRLDNAQEELSRIVGFDLNPNSPKQVQDYMYDKLKLVPVKDRKTKRPTCGVKALEILKNKYPSHRSTIEKILDYRGASKIIGTFLKPLLVNGKLLTTYNVSGTVNGRLSSSKNIHKEGVNVQQTPKTDLRRMFICPDGMIMIKTDLSQAEARVVFWDGKIFTMINRYLDDPSFDIHRWNANNIFKIGEDNITKDQRHKGKAGVHGGNYGLGPQTAAGIYQISYKDAKESIYGYKNALPELKAWWDKIENDVIGSRKLVNVFGRQRIFMGRLDHELFRSAYSFKPQSTIADIINRVFIVTERSLDGIGYPYIQAHDEIVFIVRREHELKALEIIKNAYNIKLEFEGVNSPLVIPVDISHGLNWHDQETIS